MSAADTIEVFGALAEGGAEVRFVGGCVRDAILGRAVSDIDLATDAEPNRILELLGEKKIRAVPTGADHGTITAIPVHRPFQITTLRHDVETDGRRAKVSFTSDWAADAARRDFTINALSADMDGTIHDYVDGLADLHAGRVRFIGDAGERIAEDYLRILRFFRFQASYAAAEPDQVALDACREAAEKVENLSGERVWQELSRILAVAAPGTVFSLMDETGILTILLPVDRSINRLQALAALEDMVGVSADPVRRLTALIQSSRREASQIAARFRLSRDERSRLGELTASRGESSPGMAELALRRSLYMLGSEFFCELVLLDWADQIVHDPAAATRSAPDWKATWDAAEAWQMPGFPLTGADVIDSGVRQSPEVGEILAEIEEWWVDQAFRPDRDRCLDRLRVVVRRR